MQKTDVERPRGWPPARSARGRVRFEKPETTRWFRWLLGLSPSHWVAIFLTVLILAPHHFASSNLFPMGTPREVHHLPFGVHLISCPKSCPASVPMANPSLFFTFSRIPVALHHLRMALLAYLSSVRLLRKSTVSSANCDIL